MTSLKVLSSLKKEEVSDSQSRIFARKDEHNCAKKVCHEEFGEGTCIFGQHAEPDRNGFVHHYDVMFEHGVEKGMPITEMKVLEEGLTQSITSIESSFFVY